MTGAEFLQTLISVAMHPTTKKIGIVLVEHFETMKAQPVEPSDPDIQTQAESYSFGDIDDDIAEAEIVDEHQRQNNVAPQPQTTEEPKNVRVAKV
ncbi:hypothetical protein [Serratia fonticola]|uniref:hypothetical protein n=1 Tax=Serratia fonticola TaxID=47917 RepID=UPI00093FFDBE|nr:hypothetical protein [Serratia fonticola]OKP17400.1 hypothetical protein BSQ40_28645 [Serratia fonticola]